MNALYRFFRSVRLAVALLLGITVLSMLSTMVPQGQPESWYRDSYAQGLAAVVLATNFDNFFSSVFFLVPTALFVVNLATCTVYRLVSRARTGAPSRHGPDLVHVALLVLAIGGITTALTRRERYFTLGAGDIVEINGRYRIELLDFRLQTYESGRPRDWISTVRVFRDGETLLEEYGIEVNRPLRLGLLRIYQTSFDTEGVVRLTDSEGRVHELTRGKGVPVGTDTLRYLVAFEASTPGVYTAVFRDVRGETVAAVSRATAGDTVGAYTIQEIEARELTGLTAGRDPGYIPVLIALVLGCVGLALTFIQRNRGEPTS